MMLFKLLFAVIVPLAVTFQLDTLWQIQYPSFMSMVMYKVGLLIAGGATLMLILNVRDGF